MWSIYLKIAVDEKWHTKNFDFKSLKCSPPGQFLGSSNSRRYHMLSNFLFIVPTLPFWTGGSLFKWAAPILPFLPEISCFEMTLIWMSDIYEFFRSVTLFTNSMEKSWLLVTKLGACITLGNHLHHKQ